MKTRRIFFGFLKKWHFSSKDKLFGLQFHTTNGFTMKSQCKTIILFLCLPILPCFFFPVKSASTPFPVDLILTYHITDDAFNAWNERYEIIRWAPELGESVLIVNFSSTEEYSTHQLLSVDISTWNILLSNGSATDQVLQPPLWVDTSLWHLGDTIQVPTYSGEFHLSSEYTHVSSGTYLCWLASSVAWLSIDDDYQLSREIWHFHHSQGILIKHTSELLASQHAIYTYKFTRELTTNNLGRLGIFSVEEQSQQVLQTIGLTILLLVPFVLGSAFGYGCYRKSKHH